MKRWSTHLRMRNQLIKMMKMKQMVRKMLIKLIARMMMKIITRMMMKIIARMK